MNYYFVSIDDYWFGFDSFIFIWEPKKINKNDLMLIQKYPNSLKHILDSRISINLRKCGIQEIYKFRLPILTFNGIGFVGHSSITQRCLFNHHQIYVPKKYIQISNIINDLCFTISKDGSEYVKLKSGKIITDEKLIKDLLENQSYSNNDENDASFRPFSL